MEPEKEVVLTKEDSVKGDDEEAVVVAEPAADDSSEDLKKGEEEEDIDPVDFYPVREFHLNWFKDPISFNPLVSAIGCLCLWGLSIWCMGKHSACRHGLLTLTIAVRDLSPRLPFCSHSNDLIPCSIHYS